MEIAQKSKLPQTTIDLARSLMSKEHVRFEELLKSALQKRNSQAAGKRNSNSSRPICRNGNRSCSDASARTRRREAEFQRKRSGQTTRSTAQNGGRIPGAYAGIKDAQPADMQAAREKLRKFIADNKKDQLQQAKKIRGPRAKASDPDALKEGSVVALLDGEERGTIESIRNDKAVVVFGQIRTTVPQRTTHSRCHPAHPRTQKQRSRYS